MPRSSNHECCTGFLGVRLGTSRIFFLHLPNEICEIVPFPQHLAIGMRLLRTSLVWTDQYVRLTPALLQQIPSTKDFSYQAFFATSRFSTLF